MQHLADHKNESPTIIYQQWTKQAFLEAQWKWYIFSCICEKSSFGRIKHHCRKFSFASFQNLWKSSIPSKCKFFIWTVIHQRINTMMLYRGETQATAYHPNGVSHANLLSKTLIIYSYTAPRLNTYGKRPFRRLILFSLCQIQKNCALSFAISKTKA